MLRIFQESNGTFKYKNGILINSNCIEEMKKMEPNSIDCILTDPPYGLKFMGRKWDTFKSNKYFRMWNKKWAKEALRVLKPGGNMIVFGGSTMFHHMMVGIEYSGFELRDTILWLNGQGMSHGYNIGQSLEKYLTTGKARRKDRDLGGLSRHRLNSKTGKGIIADTGGQIEITQELAKKYQGFNSQLKPSFEAIIWFRKPLSEKNLVLNVLKHGTGGINIDDCRIPYADVGEDKRLGGKGSWSTKKAGKKVYDAGYRGDTITSSEKGRYPCNTIHDGSEEVEAEFAKYGIKKSGKPGIRRKPSKSNSMAGTVNTTGKQEAGSGDSGSISRFFYCSKTPIKEKKGTIHPTQKPISLSQYLVRLFTPPDGIILDCFAGTNSIGIAAYKEGFRYVGIEKDSDNFKEAIHKTKEHIKDISNAGKSRKIGKGTSRSTNQ